MDSVNPYGKNQGCNLNAKLDDGYTLMRWFKFELSMYMYVNDALWLIMKARETHTFLPWK